MNLKNYTCDQLSIESKRVSDTRIVIVADRGLNTSDNIYYLNGSNKSDDNPRDGYVYGQSIRGASNEFKQWVLSGGYEIDTLTNDEGEDIVFKHKSRIYPKELNLSVTTRDGKPKKTKTGCRPEANGLLLRKICQETGDRPNGYGGAGKRPYKTPQKL